MNINLTTTRRSGKSVSGSESGNRSGSDDEEPMTIVVVNSALLT